MTQYLREYEEVLASPEFVRLSSCTVCNTTKGCYMLCQWCLFNGTSPVALGCIGKHSGFACRSKADQLAQFRHLLRRLDESGYEFK